SHPIFAANTAFLPCPFAEKLEKLAPGSLLLPAEGQGRNAVFAAKMGWDVHAFDFSEMARIKAFELAEQEGVSFKYDVMSFESLELPLAAYDAIGLVFVHTSPDMRQKLHRDLIPLLKPEGMVILEAFHKTQLGLTSGGPKSDAMLFSEEELREDFQELDIISVEVVTRQLDEGPFHQGEAHIIQMMAHA
ncbi:MAG: class I SAM-dependent methyltransferase, partial [Bacteroidota bacterium]